MAAPAGRHYTDVPGVRSREARTQTAHAMYVGIGILDLELPYAEDLKAKRRIVRSLVERLHSRHRISAAETGALDRRQRAEVGVAIVGASAAAVESMLEEVLRLADAQDGAVVIGWEPTVLEEGG